MFMGAVIRIRKERTNNETRTVLYSAEFGYMREDYLEDAKSTRNSSKPETEIVTV